MKESFMNFFNQGNLKNKILVKLWDAKNNKWYFEVVNVKKQERDAIISYSELVRKKVSRDNYDKNRKCRY